MHREIPVIGQQQQRIQAAVTQQLQQLSLQIYVQVAAEMISSQRKPTDKKEALVQCAQESQKAARAYFEAIGVQFSDGEERRS